MTMTNLQEYIRLIQSLSTNKGLQLQYIREARQQLARGRLSNSSKFELAQFHTIGMTECTTRSERWLHRRMLSRCGLDTRAFLRCIIVSHTYRSGYEPHPMTLEFGSLGMAIGGPYALLRHGRI